MGRPPPGVKVFDLASVTLAWECDDHRRATLEMQEAGGEGDSDWVRLYSGLETTFKASAASEAASGLFSAVPFVFPERI